jgi:hypothetical protein
MAHALPDRATCRVSRPGVLALPGEDSRGLHEDTQSRGPGGRERREASSDTRLKPCCEESGRLTEAETQGSNAHVEVETPECEGGFDQRLKALKSDGVCASIQERTPSRKTRDSIGRCKGLRTCGGDG